MNGGYQIGAGHHRVEAAKLVGLIEIPCWVTDLDDDEFFMLLVLSNAQGELSLLEQGMHVLQYVAKHPGGRGKKGGVVQYAQRLGKKTHTHLVEYRNAAAVFLTIQEKTCPMSDRFIDKAYHLAAIHKAPEDTWPALATQLLSANNGKGWSVEETEAAVKRVNELLKAVPDWWSGLDRPGLAALAAQDQAKALLPMFREAAAIAEKLEPVRLYRHEEESPVYA